MGDLFQELANRARGQARVVQPRLLSMFEPETTVEEPAPEAEGFETISESGAPSAQDRSPRSKAAPTESPGHPRERLISRAESALPATLRAPTHGIPDSRQESRHLPQGREDAGAAAPTIPRWTAPGPALEDRFPPVSEAPKLPPRTVPGSPSEPTLVAPGAPSTSADSKRAPLAPIHRPSIAPASEPSLESPRTLFEARPIPAPAPAPAPQRLVEVRIGRIEVRAATPEPPPPPRRRREPHVSLGDYLSRRQRNGGG